MLSIGYGVRRVFSSWRFVNQTRSFIEASMPNALEVAQKYDVTIQDASASDVNCLSKQFGITQSGRSTRAKQLPADGIVPIGALETYHAWFPLVLSCRSPRPGSSVSVDAVMLYDTVAPKTFLCANTLRLLGVHEGVTSGINVQIHGLPQTVYLSHGGFKDVDVLGQDFLRSHGLEVKVRMKSLTCSLDYERDV